MTNLMKIEQNLTMTSREIAELTGKEHKNVKRDVLIMLESLEKDALSFERTYLDQQNRQQSVYLLDKELTMTLVAGYSIKLRHAIVKRWQELEAQVAKPMSQIEALLASVQMLADVEKRQLEVEKQQQEVQQSLAQQKSKLLQIDNKITTGLEEVKETNLLTSCPTAAESITGIRIRMNEEYGLSASVVDAVMRQSLYAPKPVGMVRNQHESSGGSTYAVYWKKDVSTVFKRFVGECKQLMNSVWYKHPFIESKFKMNK